jgi:glycosyltransferase involved in cell wall biosynthesis
MNLSIVIPLLNEEESLPELTEWIARVCSNAGYDWELIYVDDGSTDESWAVIHNLRSNNERIKGIKFQRNYGKSAALNVAFEVAKGDVVITMDADLQDSPDEIPELYRMVMEEKWDIVSGWKKKRYDNTLTKNLPSKLFNAATRSVSGIKLHDFNCGLKPIKSG